MAPPLHPLHAGLQRRQRQHHVVRTNATVVNHARKRRPIPRLLRLPPVSINGPHHHVQAAIRPVPAGVVREAQHLPRRRVELGVRREGRRRDLALKVVAPQRLQRRGVHGERRAVLLGRQQRAAPEGHVGVAGGAHEAPRAGVVGPGVAVPPEQAAARGRLGAVAVRVHVALPEVGGAARDADGRHAAVAVEVHVVLEERREALVRLDPVEGAVDGGRDRARHLEAEDVALEARGLVHPPEGVRVGELVDRARGGELAVDVALDCRGYVEDVRHRGWWWLSG